MAGATMSKPTPPESREKEIYAEIQRALNRAVQIERSRELQKRSVAYEPATWQA